nr:hypothetical protein BaRGS_028278 [Batillaria attramentaria]
MERAGGYNPEDNGGSEPDIEVKFEPGFRPLTGTAFTEDDDDDSDCMILDFDDEDVDEPERCNSDGNKINVLLYSSASVM